jgi:hypothetical protein
MTLTSTPLPAITDEGEDISNYKISTGNVTIDSMNTANTMWSSGSSGIYHITPNGSGGSGSYTYTTNNTAGQWSTTPYITTGASQSGLQVKGDAEFEGNVKIKGRDIGKLFEKVEDRLAILMEPDPEKLKKFAALKKAYDHYKLMEKLIGDDEPNNTTK